MEELDLEIVWNSRMVEIEGALQEAVELSRRFNPWNCRI